MSTEGLISARTLWEGVKELEGRHKAEAKYNPEHVVYREERLIRAEARRRKLPKPAKDTPDE